MSHFQRPFSTWQSHRTTPFERGSAFRGKITKKCKFKVKNAYAQCLHTTVLRVQRRKNCTVLRPITTKSSSATPTVTTFSQNKGWQQVQPARTYNGWQVSIAPTPTPMGHILSCWRSSCAEINRVTRAVALMEGADYCKLTAFPHRNSFRWEKNICQSIYLPV